MSEESSNSKDNSLNDSSGSKNDILLKYELITSYIDNEIKSETEKQTINNLIETDPDIYNRYSFEKLTKECLQKSIKPIETPLYVYKDIGLKINKIIENSSKANQLKSESISQAYSNQIQLEKSNFKKYLIYGSYVLIALVAFSFILNNFLKKNPELLENDIVAVSRNVFNKIDSGKVEPNFKTNNCKELTDSMNKYLDFKVFIPDSKDVILVGGICNEMYGVKIAHFIHKKGSIVIYTLQADKNELMSSRNKLILCDEFKDNLKSGKNWFPCMKDKNNNVVVWYKDNVICASVSHLESEEISSALTNLK
ncbi:MAG TPA: hypothetical protein PKD83_12750 [Ignavibacteria bacterium]|nr:hypothetical protein [Ignavibacteria bacterium]